MPKCHCTERKNQRMDDVLTATLAMGEWVDDYLVHNLPSGPRRDYIRMQMAQLHTPTPRKMVPPGMIGRKPTPTKYPPPTTDASAFDPLAEAKQVVLQSLRMRVATPVDELRELTGYSGEEIKRFIEHVLSEHLTKKHLTPILSETPFPTKLKECRRPGGYVRTQEHKDNVAKGLRAYWVKKKAERSGGIDAT